jgi:serine/threonine protein phosphatase PrpC
MVGEMVIVESAGVTDVGRSRSENEDALFCDDDLRLYLVADGLGGHQAGEVASRLVVETIRDCMQAYQRGSHVDTLDGYDRSLSEEANMLQASVVRANREVHRWSSQEGPCRRMGSTVAAACFSDGGLITANVGDSPIWLVQAGEIETLSVLHTVGAEQAARHASGRGALGREFKHVLTRAIGIEAAVKVDVCEMPCFPGDILVMASDGLSNKVSTEEVLSHVSCRDPEEACRLLVALANERGGDDNITVVVARVSALQPKARSIAGRVRGWFKT